MSLWLSNKQNSNTFNRSYFKDFVDVSGDVITRNNCKIMLYGSDPTQSFPEFTIGPKEFSFHYDITNSVIDVSTNKLIFIKDLTQDVESTLNSLLYKTSHIEGNAEQFVITSDSSFNNDLYVGGDMSLNKNLAVYGNTQLVGKLYVNDSVTFSGNVDMSYQNIDVSKILVNTIDATGEINQFN